MRHLLLLLFMVSFVSTSFGQINFYRLFGGEEFDYAHDVAEMPDSGFLVVGTSGSFNVGHSDAFLVRTNKYGTWLWSIPYGGVENDGASDLEYKEGFGTYLLGRTTAPGGDFDAWILFVDDQGSIIWERTYPGSDWEEATESAMTLDSGLIVGVRRFGSETQALDYSILRLDNTGDTVWSQEISGAGDDEITNIESYQDSMFLISSNHWDSLNGETYGLIELIHEDGTLVWNDTIGISPGSSWINDFYFVNDTLFAVGTHKLDDTSTFNRMRHVRFLPNTVNGEILTNISVSAGNMIDDVVMLVPNSQFKWGAFRFQDPMGSSPNSDFYVALNSYNLTPIGANSSTNTYGEDRLYNGIPTKDGGAIFVGYQSLPNGGTAMVMLKVGSGYVYPIVPDPPYVQNLVGQNELQPLSTLIVYPNPASNDLNIFTGEENVNQYALVNLEGKKLTSGAIIPGETTISVEGIQSGMYLLQFYKDEKFVGAKQIMVR